jgi:hypothetical protein
MHTVMSFRASSVPPEQVGRIVCDYLALDRARIVRRLMVARCGLLALAAGTLETTVHGFSPLARMLTVALCLVPPAWAWVAELVYSRRLLRVSRTLPGHS